MASGLFKGRERLALLLLILLGIALRLILPLRGHNFDFESYQVVSDIAASGGNVYDETKRYNYGPIWFLFLGAMRWLAYFVTPSSDNRIVELVAEHDIVFRMGIVAVLTLADLAISYLLYRRYGGFAALLFFLNPVSIVITGLHNQFDNVAIAIALAAMVLAERAQRQQNRRDWWIALLLLGLSISTKHVFFMLPLWLALRPGPWGDRVLALTVPLAVFFASFLPFAATGWPGILQNVFLYKGHANTPLLHLFLPAGAAEAVPSILPMLLALLAAGYAARRLPLFQSALLYTVVLVVFSPAIANQYLAIVMPAVAASMNLGYGLYTAAATLLLAAGRNGLRIEPLRNLLGTDTTSWLEGYRGYDLPIAFLTLGLALHAWSLRRGSGETTIRHAEPGPVR